MAAAHIGYVTLGSSFGSVVVVWDNLGSRPEVLRVFLKGRCGALYQVKERYPEAVERACPVFDLLTRGISEFLGGADVSFDLGAVALERCPAFQQRVLPAVHAVPRGRVTTYGRLASEVGRPIAARAVGHALATNPFPLVIPCHRAVRRDGSLGGYQGGIRMKRVLLEIEGVQFEPDGRVARSFLLT